MIPRKERIPRRGVVGAAGRARESLGVHRNSVWRNGRPGNGVRSPGVIRVEWQIFELGTGELLRYPPKDDSQRTIDAPEWLGYLITAHIARTEPKACQCHDLRYVFGGHRAANGAADASEITSPTHLYALPFSLILRASSASLIPSPWRPRNCPMPESSIPSQVLSFRVQAPSATVSVRSKISGPYFSAIRRTPPPRRCCWSTCFRSAIRA